MQIKACSSKPGIVSAPPNTDLRPSIVPFKAVLQQLQSKTSETHCSLKAAVSLGHACMSKRAVLANRKGDLNLCPDMGSVLNII